MILSPYCYFISNFCCFLKALFCSVNKPIKNIQEKAVLVIRNNWYVTNKKIDMAKEFLH